MPALVATKGQITKSADRKRALSRQLRRLHREIEKAEEELRKISSSFAEKRSRIGRPVKTNINKCCSKENRVLEMKRLEVNELVDEILEMYEYVWEGMCGRSLQSLDFSGAMTAEEHRKIHRMSDLKNVLPLVPHDIMLSEVLKLMEEYRKLMLDHHELSTLKQGLRLQNSELLVLLKCYHAHRNSS
ncbi:uncharacterized protein LOC129232481 [Uloborus diversus]|uniref:uncharacterized protein LOC129232481 n=1 Tax=Uloborus diversus TaxID=327109 RepID=UPI00240A50F7|nr:uncharacterized protein LOC129232481 [Uloborus diversus]